ncbi:MAG: helix-turn-helix domain-containing protein [Phycisphaerales bacterium JB063]
MAKMFYTLEEAASKLGVDEQTVKDMASRNELQQFRDGDKLMFKRDQIDAKSSGGASDGPIPLADSSINDAIDLKADTVAPMEDSREATGVSVFDANEVELADPMAQTQMTQPVIDDEDLALESVGSGSGLLDLTRESDDTSLGAELLDEIYPGGGDTGMGTGTGMAMDSAVGSSGVFDGAISMETGQSGPSGLENLSAGPAVAATPASGGTPVSYEVEEYDPAGSGFGAGMLFGVIAAMVVGLGVVIPILGGVQSTLLDMINPLEKPTNVYILAGVLLLVSVVFGVIGMVVGKATSK